jgi:hypothetical protein
MIKKLYTLDQENPLWLVGIFIPVILIVLSIAIK